MKKKASILIFVILILGLIGFGICICIFIPDATDLNEQRIHIPRNIQLRDGETIKIILPKTIVVSTHGEIDDIVKELEENLEQEDVYANKDGTITEVLTQEQLEQRILRTENSLTNKIKTNKNIRIVIDDNFNKAEYYVTKECTFLDWICVQLDIRYCLILAQIYSGISYDEWQIDDKVIYEDGDILMFEFHLEENGTWDISASEWDEKMKEVSGQ